ncbi:hypothetical protein [Pseudarthrobacter sp. MDT1-22]
MMLRVLLLFPFAAAAGFEILAGGQRNGGSAAAREVVVDDVAVLRSIRLGQTRTNLIAQLSGVSDSLVRSSAAGLAADGNLIYSIQDGSLALTPLGERLAIEMATIEPVQRPFKVCFDRTLWRVKEYDPRHLVQKSQVRDEQMQILPAFKSSRIADDDVTVANLNALIRKGDSTTTDIDILRILRLSGNTHRFLPVQMLIYVDPGSYDLDIAILIDDELSGDHEFPLISLDVIGKLSLNVSPGIEREPLADAIEVARQAAPTGQSFQSLVSKGLSQIAPVFGFEHNAWLEKALTTTKSRLLVVTPSLDKEIMTHQILPKISTILREGAEIKLAFGVAKEENGSNTDLHASIASIRQKYPASFSIAWGQEVQFSSLVFDDTWIQTGFEWFTDLEFDPTAVRLHEGTAVQSRRFVDETYRRLSTSYFGL